MMNLYSGTTDPFSHRCRIVLFEKGMDFQVIDVDLDHKPEDIAVINPYNRVPVLVDRDLVLHEANIINEYIDERFPHPQLMPPDPILRAKARQLLHSFEQELFSDIATLEKNLKGADKVRASIRDQLTQLAPILANQTFLLGEEFSMLDVAVAPLLWRLEHYGIDLPKAAVPLMNWSSAYRRLWPVGQRAIGVSEAPVAADMTAWHTYVIEWQERRARFLVDGDVVLDCDTPPRGPLGLVIWLDNQSLVLTPQGRLRHRLLRQPSTQWLELAEVSVE